MAVVIWVKETLVDFDTNSTALEAPICLAVLVAFAVVPLRSGVAQGIYEAIWAQVIASLSFECMDCATMWRRCRRQTQTAVRGDAVHHVPAAVELSDHLPVARFA